MNTPTSNNENMSPSPMQLQVTNVASCPEIRNPSPSSSPQPSPKLQPKFLDKPQSSPSSASSVSRDPSVEKNIGEIDSNFAAGNEDAISRSSDSVKSVDLQRSTDTGSIRDFKDKKSSDKKKKSSSWYNVLNPTYKSRSDEFKRLFKDLPEHERLIVDYSCALQKDILVHGRLYISQNYICFYANIFRWETCLVVRCKDVTAMTKEKTARVIPNAIQICSNTEKHFFTSFGARDKTYLMLFRVWQNALMEQPMSIQELWQWVHYSYGEELGLTSDDDDYVAPCALDEDGKNGNGLPKTPSEANFDLSSKASSVKESLCGSVEHHLGVNGSGSCKEYSDNPETPADGNKILASELLTSSPSSHSVEKMAFPLAKMAALAEPPSATELSDTTESENEITKMEIPCQCEGHVGKEVINTVYPMTVDHAYTLLFCGSKFFLDFLHSRKTVDVVQSAWQDSPEGGKAKIRQVTYTLNLNLSMGPKTAQTTETQTMMSTSKSGSLYCIEVDAVNTGIPYSDAFYTCHRYCITRVSTNKCRIRVHSQIKYRKSVWGLVKTFIEKNAMQGVEEYMKELETILHRECARNLQLKPKKARRRRRLLKGNVGDEGVDGLNKAIHNHTSIKRIGANISPLEISRVVNNPDSLVKIILIVLLGLLFLNALLYYKLWSLENQTSKMSFPPTLLDLEILKSSPRTPEEWAQLVQQQETLHQVELQKWTEILQSAVQLLQQTEDTLTTLQKNIRPYQMQRIMQFLMDQPPKTEKAENEEAATSS